MRKIIFLFLFFPFILSSQYVKELNYPDIRFGCNKWTADWITSSEVKFNEHNVLFFRKSFELNQNTDSFIIHITANKQYFLYVNSLLIFIGTPVVDALQWNYETIDIAPFLVQGKNTIAVQVNNWSAHNSEKNQFSNTSFLIQGFSDKEKIVNSNIDWKVLRSQAHKQNSVRQNIDVTGKHDGYSTDSIFGNQYPWYWQKSSFDDSKWLFAKKLNNTDKATTPIHLVPRNIPLKELEVHYLGKLVRNEGMQILQNPFNGKDSLLIPKEQKITLLFDQQDITIGYPFLELSKGVGSKIKIKYAESLCYKSKVKGNRNDIKDKIMMGMNDVILPNGNMHCQYISLWMRSFRYIQIEIETKEQPLTIHNFKYRYTASPVQLKASFECDDALLQPVWNACWHTNKLCAQEFLMNNSFSEQYENIVTARIQALVLYALSGERNLIKNTLEHFNNSIIKNGLMETNTLQNKVSSIPFYSLAWIDMIYDYMMNSGNVDCISKFKNSIDSVLNYYEKQIDKTGLIKPTSNLNFSDWFMDRSSSLVETKDKGSALLSLHYLYTLQHAISIYNYIGNNDKTNYYTNLADQIKMSVYNQCWSPEKGLIAETSLKNNFSQHTNIMAVLTNTVSQPEYKTILQKVSTGIGMTKNSVVYDFYYFEALKKSGMPELFFQKMELWKSISTLGLFTIPESFDNPHSDCSPRNTYPAYEFLSFICGIQPAEEGFNTVKIAPQLGLMKEIKATYPHIKGDIIIELNRKGEKGIAGIVILPEGLNGVFIWNEQEIILHQGKQKINAK